MKSEKDILEMIASLKAKNETLQKWLEDNITVSFRHREARMNVIECNKSKIQMLQEVLAS